MSGRSPSGREVDVGRTLNEDEYIGMTRREVLDGYLRDRAIEFGAKPINGLVQKIELPEKAHAARSREPNAPGIA